MSVVKAKEYWIDLKPYDDDLAVVETEPSDSMKFCYIHVIEFEAYRKAVEALKEISQNICAFHAELMSPSDMALKVLKELGETQE